MLGCLCYCLALGGCGQQHRTESLPQREAVPYVTAKELSESISSAKSPILVEFSVPTGCYRCDQMRQQIDMLAKNSAGRLQVCRVNLTYERSLATQFGISVCPTYVVFDAGKEVFRQSYPTSGDLLLAELNGVLAAP